MISVSVYAELISFSLVVATFCLYGNCFCCYCNYLSSKVQTVRSRYLTLFRIFPFDKVLTFTLVEKRTALPFGIIFWLLSVACLISGLANYIKTVTKYSRREALVQAGWKTQMVQSSIISLYPCGCANETIRCSQWLQQQSLQRASYSFRQTLAVVPERHDIRYP